jgi:hypothetical protein
MSKKLIKRIILWVIFLPVLLFLILTTVIYHKQDEIVQELITTVNADFNGELEISGSHISPFANFPYISIDLENVKVYENKAKNTAPLFDVAEMYIGFSIWEIIGGKFNIKALKLLNGSMKIVQHQDGSINLGNALSSTKQIENVNEEFHLDIKSIELENIDLVKINEASQVELDFYVTKAKSSFKTSPEHIMVAVESKFELSILLNGDSTFVKHKHFVLETHLDFITADQILQVQESEVQLEKALFKMAGQVDFDDEMNLNLTFEGEKPNFDLFLAFAPAEMAPALERYKNGGNIYFKTSITGKSINGHNPRVEAEFGCEEAFFSNIENQKKLDELYFKGHFSTGEKGNAETMEFSLTDVRAKPETGVFSGSLFVKNFDSPDININLKSEFKLDFLAQFLNLTELQELTGSVALTMNFHDIVDLSQPEKSIEKLNESYYTELEVKDLGFKTPGFHLPVHGVNISATMDGHQADIRKLQFKIGNSDITIRATVSDLPAILHHTSEQVRAHLDIESKLIDLEQLSSGDTSAQKPIKEQITNMKMSLEFLSSARAFTEFKNLPAGEFFIEDFYAKFQNYPHTLHDFHADVFIDENNFRVIDFTGMIDKSDFHFSGKLDNYDLWFEEDPKGDTKIDFSLVSDLLQIHDLFSYQGENFVPEDYRHEEFKNLHIHGLADLHFNSKLYSADINLDKVEASMKVHPMRFEKLQGRIHLEDEHITVENLQGKVGKSDFKIDMNYYVGTNDEQRKKDNFFKLSSNRLDFDELFAYNPPPKGSGLSPAEHDSVFSIFDIPFTDMRIEAKIDHLNYHRFLIDNINSKVRIQKNHFLYIDEMKMQAAGGDISVKGYFNGSDRNNIYFSPTLELNQVNLDKLLFKFENFGQDHLVSENLHGAISGKLTGKIHVHADLVPIIDDSEIHFDMQVTDGKLENYSAFEALAEYFSDKNLKSVRFDTLSNHIDIKEGVMSIPSMTINSTLGFIEISGKQDMNLNMEYYVRIPVKMATKAGLSKLFGGKAEINPNQEDEIIYRDEDKRVKFINIKITGTPDDYDISMGKDKK